MIHNKYGQTDTQLGNSKLGQHPVLEHYTHSHDDHHASIIDLDQKNLGKFELFKAKNNEWYFRLKARNGEIIAVSEGYNTKDGALNGIESVRKNAQTKKVIEV